MSVDGYGCYKAWKKWTGAFGEFTAAEALYFNEELRRCGLRDIHGLAVLEIGFGNGRFAGWARAQGARYLGTEVIPALVEDGRSRGFSVHSADVGLSSLACSSRIDLVVAMDVFEHLSGPGLRGLLDEVNDILRPGGVLLARVPSGDSPFSRAIQHGDFTHRSVIGSSSVHQIAQEAGFIVAAVREPAWPLLGLGMTVFVRRLLVAVVRRCVYPFISRFLMGGGSPVLSPNMVFVLTKK